MATANDGLARTLKDAYRACDVKPLSAANIDRYYVAFPARNNTISDVNMRLFATGLDDVDERGTPTFETILFSGHIGCGKSSELANIALRQQDSFLVVNIQAEAETDILDVTHTDIYLVIIKRVEFELRQLGLRFNNALLNSVEEWFMEITEEKEETVTRSVNVEAEASLGANAPFLAKLLVKLMAQIKASATEKRKIRQVLESEFSRLTTDINLLLLDAAQILKQTYPDKKGILLVIDGLDKCPPNVAKRLFSDYATQLQSLQCTIIYTVPISTLYKLGSFQSAFGDPHIIPMINVYQRDPSNPKQVDLDYSISGLNDIAQMLEKRVDVDAIFEHRDLLLEMAQFSGGHVRHMMQMMRGACLQAMGMGHTKIQEENVVYAAKQIQFRFERSIPRAHYPELARIAQQKQVTDDEIGRDLLFSGAVLEYNGTDRWVYPHPLVRQIELFKTAVANLQSLNGSQNTNG